MHYDATTADDNETANEIMQPLQPLYVASKIDEATRCLAAMPQRWRSAYGPAHALLWSLRHMGKRVRNKKPMVWMLWGPTLAFECQEEAKSQRADYQ